jgi:hypothetical protein
MIHPGLRVHKRIKRRHFLRWIFNNMKISIADDGFVNHAVLAGNFAFKWRNISF